MSVPAGISIHGIRITRLNVILQNPFFVKLDVLMLFNNIPSVV